MTAAASASSGRASERRSRAFLRLLANMCRQFPDLRTWLLEDFGQDAETRANFLALVERGDLTGEPVSNGLGSDCFAILWDGQQLHGVDATATGHAGCRDARLHGAELVAQLGFCI